MPQIFKAGDNTMLRFFTKADQNNFQSEKHGRPLYDTILVVEVITPGSSESLPEFEVERTYCVEADLPPRRSKYYEKYAQQVEAFKSSTGEYAVNGTPLTSWPQIDAGTAASLAAVGVITVEQLAEVHDGNLHNLGMGGRTLREKAKQWITSTVFGTPSALAATELTNMREALAAKEQELAALRHEVAMLRAANQQAPAPETAQIFDPSPVGAVSGDLGATPPANPFGTLSGPAAAQPPPGSATVI